MIKKLFAIVLLIFLSNIYSQTNSPKRELRGVWVASLGIDWPSVTGTSAAVIANQKAQLISIFDSHKSYGLNAIFFHVRPLCDAVYKSNYEPWSNFLTGTQGVAPSDTSYDPLELAIEEAHKRGMELHAWLNPYRAESSNGSQVSANHVINKHPDWIIKCSTSQYRFLDPGLPAVRQYVLRVVMDIVERYDVDGIHFDDYFYPYTDYGTFNDDSTFAKYPNGFTDRAAWRKNNVDLLLKMISDSIKAVKPWVKFGVSPSGNQSVNASIYVSTADWLAGNYTDTTGTPQHGDPYIDYIMPQLYWPSYGGYLNSWTSPAFLNGRHLYIGQAAYRYAQSTFPPNELSWEIATNRTTPTISGGVFFSSQSVTGNLGYCNDTLEYNYFTHPAITPKMDWKDAQHSAPNSPLNCRFEINSSTGNYELHWDKPTPTNTGDTAFSYVVYRSVNNPPDINDSTNMFGTTGQTYLSSDYAKYSVTKGTYYVVTAINRYSNESTISNAASLNLLSLVPSKPVLTSPINNSNDLSMTATLKWTGDSNAERYVVQVSQDSTFNSGLELYAAEYKSTQITFSNVVPGKVYYWRVKAYGQVGESDYSDVYSFESGIPLPPILSLPAHASTNVSLTPTFSWFKSEGAGFYEIQLATAVQFYSNTLVVDTTITDTSFTPSVPLLPNKIYYWRVNAKNMYGVSFWPTGFGFKTTSSTDIKENKNIPMEFTLEQNYPNPFNPSTTIRFHIKDAGHVTLKVFDISGKEVASIIDQQLTPGVYSTTLIPGHNLSSGVYIYRLEREGISISNKMILMK